MLIIKDTPPLMILTDGYRAMSQAIQQKHYLYLVACHHLHFMQISGLVRNLLRSQCLTNIHVCIRYRYLLFVFSRACISCNISTVCTQCICFKAGFLLNQFITHCICICQKAYASILLHISLLQAFRCLRNASVRRFLTFPCIYLSTITLFPNINHECLISNSNVTYMPYCN